jgi:hypothetical protein
MMSTILVIQPGRENHAGLSRDSNESSIVHGLPFGAATGRWSGQLIQPQNFPRPTLEAAVDPEELAAAVKTGDPERLRCWGKPIDVLVSGWRHALTAADGAMLGAGDFSMVECCVLLALAGEHDKCELIAQGVDVYRDMAATIYGLDRAAFMAIPEDQLSPEETEQRRIGKNGVLSSGYGIGVEGFYRRFCRHIEGARDEFLLAATAQNLRRLARLRPIGALTRSRGRRSAHP